MEQKNVEGVIIIRNAEREIVGFVRNDMKERRPIIYKAEEMGFSDMEELFK